MGDLSRRTRREDVSRVLSILGPVIGLLAIYVLFACLVPRFGTFPTFQLIARQTAIVGIGALGMTMIIIAGGIDLSVGSVIALSTVVIACILQWGLGQEITLPMNMSPEWAIPIIAALGGILAGAVCGLFNGMLITRLRVVPFIVTLGTLLIARGVAKGLAKEQKIDAPMTWLNDILASTPPLTWWEFLMIVVNPWKWVLVIVGLFQPDRGIQVFPAGVWVMLAMAILVAVLLHKTRFGRHLFAIGSNERAAWLSGISVNRVKVTVYAISSAFAGLAGLMQFSRLTVGDPTVAVGSELDIIAAVVIGGGSLSGGEGSVLGTIVGAFIMSVIRSGCTQMGLPNWVQEIVTGSIIVIAVALDRLRHRRSG